MHNLIQDVRFALRGWRRSPGFAAAAIATLALGIGANTAIFSVVSGVLLRPLPFAHPEQLVQVYERQPRTSPDGGFDGPVVYADFDEWRSKGRLIAGISAYTHSSMNLQDAGDAEQVSIVGAEASLFHLLGVPPFMGRVFSESEAPNVAIASYRFWKTHFGESPALGRTITLDGQPFTLIGVMPEEFQFPYQSTPNDLYLPRPPSADLRAHPNRRLEAVVARVKPGVVVDAARQELNAMQSASQGRRVVRLQPLQDVVSGPARESLLVLLGAVAMVLLVASVNVANLLLARTASRSREIAVRAALGAGRFRLAAQFLTESLLLAACGGAAGLALGIWGSRILVRIAAAEIPRLGEVELDWRVFGFLLLMCAATGIGFGLAPALAAARGGAAALKQGSVRAWLRDALVVVEITLAFVLLAGAGLLLRTFLNLQRTSGGVNAQNVLTAHVVVSGAAESSAIEERVSRIPGVRAAGMISLLPLQNSGWGGFFNVAGRPELHACELSYVTPGYFRAMGIPLHKGRGFSSLDVSTSERVIIVNEALARAVFPGEDPIGRKTSRGTIVGVMGDVRQQTLSAPAIPEVYNAVAQNFAQMRSTGSTLVVRSSGPPDGLVRAIRAAVREASPGQALFRVATMQQVIEQSLATPRLYMWLLALFAGMATLLAAAGIYAVVAYLVALRTREFGIRMALGADAARVLRLVMKRGAVLASLGLTLGIGGAAILTRLLRGMLYGVQATDATTFALMAALLGAVALAACLVPARRAALVDPAVALRSE